MTGLTFMVPLLCCIAGIVLIILGSNPKAPRAPHPRRPTRSLGAARRAPLGLQGQDERRPTYPRRWL